jgi:molybdopterin-synthase adenylyltransferase
VDCAAQRISSFNSEVDVIPVQSEVRSAADVRALLRSGRFDLVLSAVDQPAEVRGWVNEACVTAGVPFITAGFRHGRGLYTSVSPGRSGCWACLQAQRDRDASLDELMAIEPADGGISPAASLTAALIGLEAVRYLTGFAPPVSAGTVWVVDFAQGRWEAAREWSRLPDCSLCGRDAGAASAELETRN